MLSWYRDYWVEAIDETTDSTYYFNTWSQETRWTKPYEMVISTLLRVRIQYTCFCLYVCLRTYIDFVLLLPFYRSMYIQGYSESKAAVPPGWIRKKDAKLRLSYFYHPVR